VEADRRALAARAPKASDDRVPAAIRAGEDLSAALAALAEAARRGDPAGVGEPLARAEQAAR
jgi:hypothetical protein